MDQQHVAGISPHYFGLEKVLILKPAGGAGAKFIIQKASSISHNDAFTKQRSHHNDALGQRNRDQQWPC